MSTTFDPNRVSPGTFELVQDPSTGVYSVKRVGFTKLPSLTLPTLGSTPTAATTTTQTTKQDESTVDTGPKVIRPTTGGAEDRVDIPNITTPGDTMDDAAKVSQNLQSGFLASGAAGGARLPSTSPQEGFLASGAAGGASLQQVDENKIDRGNPTGDPRVVSEEQGLVGKPAMLGDTGASMDQMSGAGTAKVPDAVKFGQPAVEAKKTFSESVKTALKGFKTPAMAALKSVSDAVIDPQQKRLNDSNAAALGSLGYKTRGQLGSSTDSGRIAGNPADNVFAGMNLKSARGNVMTASKARIDKIKASAAKTTDKAKAARMKAKAAKFEKQRQAALDRKEKQQAAKNKKDLATGGVAPGASGGGSGGCFIKGTLVTMANGSKKPIEKINLGDYVAEGGKVFATGKFLINDLYNYKGIKVSGSHMVKENNVWTRVEDSRYGKLINTDEHVVYIFGSENRRILIDNILFTDYFEITDQEKLISEKDKFFDNWKIHEANEDINNINILNAN